MTKKIGYLRVSTLDQNPQRQIDALQDICDELHIEKLSATSRRRPVYEAVTASLGAGDTLVILDLDRAYRSARDALNALDALDRRGVRFHIARLDIDTRTPTGRFLYTLMGGLAEFERLTLSQRTREGLSAARRRGVRLGRPPKLGILEIDQVRRRLEKGEPAALIARSLAISHATLSRALRREQAA